MKKRSPRRFIVTAIGWLAASQSFAATESAPAGKYDSKPIEEVIALARGGDVDAVHHLCYAYSYGEIGATQDEDQAFEWCTKSHEAGVPSGTTLLAEIHSLGSQDRRDLQRARVLYRQAAEKGHDFAMYALGVLLLDDEATIQEALSWLYKASEAGIPEATAILEKLMAAAEKRKAGEQKSRAP